MVDNEVHAPEGAPTDPYDYQVYVTGDQTVWMYRPTWIEESRTEEKLWVKLSSLGPLEPSPQEDQTSKDSRDEGTARPADQAAKGRIKKFFNRAGLRPEREATMEPGLSHIGKSQALPVPPQSPHNYGMPRPAEPFRPHGR